jgi:uncharacterized damage-inducible protein DinB
MNPYAKYLDGRDAVDILRATPGEFQLLTSQLTVEQLDKPTVPGKWSLRQIFAHMADCEIVWAKRIRQVLAEPGVTIAPFDQDVWAERYSAYTAAEALSTFSALRGWNVSLLTTLTHEERSYMLSHPERGTFPLQELLELIAGHDLHHIARLRELLT